MSSFENLRVVDNFYQTSLFFPMPTVVISTLCEDGTTTLGPYPIQMACHKNIGNAYGLQTLRGTRGIGTGKEQDAVYPIA